MPLIDLHTIVRFTQLSAETSECEIRLLNNDGGEPAPLSLVGAGTPAGLIENALMAAAPLQVSGDNLVDAVNLLSWTSSSLPLLITSQHNTTAAATALEEGVVQVNTDLWV